MYIKVFVWGISLSLLIFVYENLMYDVVVYVFCRKYMKLKFDNNLIGDIMFFVKVNIIFFIFYFVFKFSLLVI